MTTVIKAEKHSQKEIKKILHPLVREWFFSKFKKFSLTQEYGVLNIWQRKNILISAPTGGTKTLTAFLSILNYLVILAEKNKLNYFIDLEEKSPEKIWENLESQGKLKKFNVTRHWFIINIFFIIAFSFNDSIVMHRL